MAKRKFKLKLPKPHPAQAQVLREAKRFNAVTCGRRWGKTEVLGIGRAIDMAIQKDKHVGYFAPTYKLSADVWRELCFTLNSAGLVRRRDSQERRLELVTGSSISMWTMDDPSAGRGRKYHRVIIDEAAHAKDLEMSWQAAILPTLADYRGDAWLLTTPKGYNAYYEITRLFESKPYGAHWRMPTSTNPYIAAEEIELHKETMSDAHFRQEFEASFEALKSRVVHQFDSVDNTLPVWRGPAPEAELLVGLDFNVNPMTACIGYVKPIPEPDDLKNPIDRLIIFDEIELWDSRTEELCQELKARYPNRVSASGKVRDVMVFPDPTGHSKGTSAPRDTTNFTILSDNGFRYDADDVPLLDDKFNEVNALACNANGTRRLFVTKNCKRLISSLEQYAFKDGTSQPQKGKYDHFVDGLCNIVHRRFPIETVSFRETEISGM